MANNLGKPSAVRLRIEAVLLVAQLSSREHTVNLMLTSGVVRAVVTFLRKHITETEEVEVSLQALRALSISASARTQSEAAGALEAIVAAQQAHALDGQLQRRACDALAFFARDPAAGKRAVQKGALEAIVFFALRPHTSDELVLQASERRAAASPTLPEEPLPPPSSEIEPASPPPQASLHALRELLVAGEMAAVVRSRPMKLTELLSKTCHTMGSSALVMARARPAV